MSDYNGYRNYETWLLNLYILEDPCWVEDIEDYIASDDFEGSYELSLRIEERVSEEIPIDDCSSFYRSLLISSISSIDFLEVADYYVFNRAEEEEDLIDSA